MNTGRSVHGAGLWWRRGMDGTAAFAGVVSGFATGGKGSWAEVSITARTNGFVEGTVRASLAIGNVPELGEISRLAISCNSFCHPSLFCVLGRSWHKTWVWTTCKDRSRLAFLNIVRFELSSTVRDSKKTSSIVLLPVPLSLSRSVQISIWRTRPPCSLDHFSIVIKSTMIQIVSWFVE